MAERIVTETPSTEEKAYNSPLKDSRFEFIVAVNGKNIFHRNFYINGFKSTSLCSVELTEAVERCAQMIQHDLEDKTSVYLYYSAPQVFKNEAEMNEYLSTHTLENPRYIVLRDNENVYCWNGEEAVPYTKSFNRADYVGEDTPCIIKFALIDHGFDLKGYREVCSKEFDGNVYPRFVRTNIDITNSKNKYENEGAFSPVEAAYINLMIKDRDSLVPAITKELCSVCSYNDKSDYTTTETFGGKTYNFDVVAQQNRYIRNLEYKCRKKTEAYLKESEDL